MTTFKRCSLTLLAGVLAAAHCVAGSDRGKVHDVKKSDKGKTLGCIAKAANDGGYSDVGAGSVRIKTS